MLRRNRLHREILRQLWERLEHTHDDQGWPWSEDCESRRRVPANISEVLDDLSEQFDCVQLIAAGIAERDEQGSLTTSPRLVPGETVLLLRSEPDSTLPFDVLASDGLLLGEEIPTYAAAHDYGTIAAVRSSHNVLLAVPTLEDVAICQELGLPAVPMAYMEAITFADLRQLEELTAAPRQLLLPAIVDQANADESRHDEESRAIDDHTAVPPVARPGPIDLLWDRALPIPTPDNSAAEDGCEVIDPFDGEMISLELIVAGWSFVRRQRISDDQIQRVIAPLAKAERFLPLNLSGVAA